MMVNNHDVHEDDEDDYDENNNGEKPNSRGEIIAFMKDMKKESKAMMNELIDIDDMLSKLKMKLADESSSKREIYRMIDSIRLRIGVMEREDRIELNEEDEAETLLEKLKKWVDQVV
jgi:hypothetical protein